MSISRRKVLARTVLAAVGVISGAVAGIATTYLFWGAGMKKRRQWTPVPIGLDGLEPGQPTKVDYLEVVPDAWATIRRRRSVWIVRNGDDMTAFDPHCTHLQCAYTWDRAREAFSCPCHGGLFDIEGQVVAGPPPRPLDRVDVQVGEDGQLMVRSGSA